MIEYNPREVFEKETGILQKDSRGNDVWRRVDNYDIKYVLWLEQRNKELIEALAHEYANECACCGVEYKCSDPCRDRKVKRQILERNTGKKIEELIK